MSQNNSNINKGGDKFSDDNDSNSNIGFSPHDGPSDAINRNKSCSIPSL